METSWDSLGECSRLVNAGGLEPREYQISIIRSLFTGKNSLVVLPTGLGKTLIGVFGIANALHGGKKALILAPTKPLSEQHYKSLAGLLKIDSDGILLLTGSTPGSERAGLEAGARVIAATPQTIANDLRSARLDLRDFGLVIFDECHRAVGRYAYTYIADECRDKGVQLVGLTASPGSRRDKIDALILSLGIENIEIRISTDPDVERYVMGKEISSVVVDNSPEVNAVLAHLKPVIDEHLVMLYKHGLSPFREFERMPKGRLLEIGDNIKRIQAANYRFMAMFNYVYVLDLLHAYDLAATEGLYPFISYMDALRGRDVKSRVVTNILKNREVVEAERGANEALAMGLEHPKMGSVVELINHRYAGKSVIVFTQYRSTVKKLVETLGKGGITARGFVGKKEGVTNAHQAQAIADFREGKFRVLVATSIAEEGLDIPSVDAVVFYEPVASEIRNIQRKGRAGRIRFGEVVILVARGTKDETYYMISMMKEKRMRDLVLRIKEQLANGTYRFSKAALSIGQKRLGLGEGH